jgi:hypothetical protein
MRQMSTQSVRHIGGRTIFNDKPKLMQPPDFDEPLDPIDSFSEQLWAQVPEPIRKDVE